MNRQKLLQQMMGAILITFLLIGCGSQPATPTSIPPTATIKPLLATATLKPLPATATLTPKIPTATPTQAFTLASSAEEVIGTWAKGNYYIRFDEDGTFRQAHSLNQLDSQPYAISSYQFEGLEMVTVGISVSGVPSCGDKVGTYEIRLFESGKIKIATIRDQCGPRAGDVAGEYEPVR